MAEKIRVFVSHSSKDQELAALLVGALQGCMVLSDGAIRCTSVPGHRLEGGAQASNALRRDLQETDVVLGLITGNSASAQWVLFELGAAWGMDRRVKPLLGPGVGFDVLPGPLREANAFKLNHRPDVLQLMDELREILNVVARPGPKQDHAITALLEGLTKLVVTSDPR